jgi:ADP-ribosylglycohydrolase
MKTALIVGDIIGSKFEGGFGATGNEELPLHGSSYTDDSVLYVATTEWLLADFLYDIEGLRTTLQTYWKNYPNRGYGEMFASWAQFRTKEFLKSYGNGAVMRVGAAGWLYPTLEKTIYAATQTCKASHNHPDSMRSACAVASLIYLGRLKYDLPKAIAWVTKTFKLPTRKLEDWHDSIFYVDALNTTGLVLNVIQSFFTKENLLDAEKKEIYDYVFRTLIYIGGDVDTNCAVAGSILEAYYDMPEVYKPLESIIPAEWNGILEKIPDNVTPKPLTFAQQWFNQV